MATNMIPILALGAAALFLMKKKGTPSTNGKTNGNGGLPSNVSLMALGNIQSGVKIGLGTELTDAQRDQVVAIVAKHARDYPQIPFGISLSQGPGIPVTAVVNGAASDYWAENISYLDLTLRDALALHFPKSGNGKDNTKPNGNGNGNGNGEEAPYPKNVSLTALAPFSWGVKIGLGTDLSDDEATQVIDIVAKHAADFPALPFEVTLSEVPGIPVTIMANNVPKDYWAEDVSYLDPTLADALAEHIPKP